MNFGDLELEPFRYFLKTGLDEYPAFPPAGRGARAAPARGTGSI